MPTGSGKRRGSRQLLGELNTSGANRRVAVELLEDSERFAELEEEWDELYRHCPKATPFQSWAWQYSWWEYYGEEYRLKLITIRDEEGLLVGLLPLMLERRGFSGRLLFVGTGITDYLDVLMREGWEEQVVLASKWALGKIGSWRVADLQELHRGAAVWEVFEEWGGPKAVVWQSKCPIIEVKPWEEVLASVSRNLRSTARRSLRRVKADGLRGELASVEGAEEAGRRLVAVSREQWSQRLEETGPEHWTRRFEEHIATTARRMTARGLGGISELKQGEKTKVSTFLVFGRNFVGSYMIGASQEALRKYQWSSLYIWDGLNIALDKNCHRFDLLRGEEEYKLRWSSEELANHRLILARNPLLWALYAGYHALRSRAKRYAYSEKAPDYIRDARDRYYRLRQGIARTIHGTEKDL